MNEAEAKTDAAKYYDMNQFLAGERGADNCTPHDGGTASYNAGYDFGIWKQEQASGVFE